jgi:radical SAM protein with 4Fe4S-binding SPASM domain
MLLNAGLKPTLNATITPSIVPLQKEMLEIVIERFHGINNLIFEPVVGKSYFRNKEAFSNFYNEFTSGFFDARNLGLKHGIELRCKAFINMFNITKYGCEIRFSLSPEGAITNCYCVSSPNEPNFENREIGKINNDNTVEFNYSKFKKMLANDVSSKEKCSDCFVKWNCGGGCLLTYENYDDNYLEILCDHIRDFSTRVLIEKYKLN